jgi:hypothetical protein
MEKITNHIILRENNIETVLTPKQVDIYMHMQQQQKNFCRNNGFHGARVVAVE